MGHMIMNVNTEWWTDMVKSSHGGGLGRKCLFCIAILLVLVVKNHHLEILSTSPKKFAQLHFWTQDPFGKYTHAKRTSLLCIHQRLSRL